MPNSHNNNAVTILIILVFFALLIVFSSIFFAPPKDSNSSTSSILLDSSSTSSSSSVSSSSASASSSSSSSKASWYANLSAQFRSFKIISHSGFAAPRSHSHSHSSSPITNTCPFKECCGIAKEFGLEFILVSSSHEFILSNNNNNNKNDDGDENDGEKDGNTLLVRYKMILAQTAGNTTKDLFFSARAISQDHIVAASPTPARTLSQTELNQLQHQHQQAQDERTTGSKEENLSFLSAYEFVFLLVPDFSSSSSSSSRSVGVGRPSLIISRYEIEITLTWIDAIFLGSRWSLVFSNSKIRKELEEQEKEEEEEEKNKKNKLKNAAAAVIREEKIRQSCTKLTLTSDCKQRFGMPVLLSHVAFSSLSTSSSSSSSSSVFSEKDSCLPRNSQKRKRTIKRSSKNKKLSSSSSSSSVVDFEPENDGVWRRVTEKEYSALSPERRNLLDDQFHLNRLRKSIWLWAPRKCNLNWISGKQFVLGLFPSSSENRKTTTTSTATRRKTITFVGDSLVMEMFVALHHFINTTKTTSSSQKEENGNNNHFHIVLSVIRSSKQDSGHHRHFHHSQKKRPHSSSSSSSHSKLFQAYFTVSVFSNQQRKNDASSSPSSPLMEVTFVFIRSYGVSVSKGHVLAGALESILQAVATRPDILVTNLALLHIQMLHKEKSAARVASDAKETARIALCTSHGEEENDDEQEEEEKEEDQLPQNQREQQRKERKEEQEQQKGGKQKRRGRRRKMTLMFWSPNIAHMGREGHVEPSLTYKNTLLAKKYFSLGAASCGQENNFVPFSTWNISLGRRESSFDGVHFACGNAQSGVAQQMLQLWMTKILSL